MRRIRFTEVKHSELIGKIAGLASSVWREYYTPLIGKAQVDYMLSRFQSPEAIQKQIEEGYRYYLFRDKEGDFIGYLGFVFRGCEMFLSKIYLRRESRGFGYAREALKFLERRARKRRCFKITLTVNKHNHNSICAYEKMGFVKTDSLVQDIGNGFVMDDYRMEKFLDEQGLKENSLPQQ